MHWRCGAKILQMLANRCRFILCHRWYSALFQKHSHQQTSFLDSNPLEFIPWIEIYFLITNPCQHIPQTDLHQFPAEMNQPLTERRQTATTSPSISDTFTSPKEIRPFPKAPARTEGQ
ncbi:hypothetical protein RRG08_004490 [Elysia crispata]|uniref:Uncharacterized protein n=1 Tax=Elysia crispata TaxID=231223 RepID=A0AAE1ED14_9GAST|nr:hypothetical protein RRG08_004490 [Elysia crispata]